VRVRRQVAGPADPWLLGAGAKHSLAGGVPAVGRWARRPRPAGTSVRHCHAYAPAQGRRTTGSGRILRLQTAAGSYSAPPHGLCHRVWALPRRTLRGVALELGDASAQGIPQSSELPDCVLQGVVCRLQLGESLLDPRQLLSQLLPIVAVGHRAAIAPCGKGSGVATHAGVGFGVRPGCPLGSSSPPETEARRRSQFGGGPRRPEYLT
jgi:hypothetical protein